MEIIPERCISRLPFVADALSSWSDQSDILLFLRDLFDKRGSVVAETGERWETNYTDYGDYLYQEGKQALHVIARKFLRNARRNKPAPGANTNANYLPTDFLSDTDFGLMAKYLIAWDATANEVLSESAFFSLAHVLESEDELRCSVLLASNLYYKQALQVLRNFLEGVVLQLYFCDDESAFKAWKNDEFRVPSFRGRNGVIPTLLARGVLSPTRANAASLLYGELNGTIHGAEHRLINQGVFTGNWQGHIFDKIRFQEWCAFFSRAVEVAIPIMQIHLGIWAQKRSSYDKGLVQCDVCHNTEFDKEDGIFAGEPRTTFHCRKCGNSMTLSGRLG